MQDLLKLTPFLCLMGAAFATGAQSASGHAAGTAVADGPDADTHAADQYIITLKDGAELEPHIAHVQALHAASLKSRSENLFLGVTHQYSAIPGFVGYAGHFDHSVIAALQQHDNVTSIERDYLWAIPGAPAAHESLRHNKRGVKKELNAPWHLSQIAFRKPVGENPGYVFLEGAGVGTFAYVLSTGIADGHRELEDIDVESKNFAGGVAHDVDGPGTHTASLITGDQYGVVKASDLVSVKVMTGKSAVTSTILKGFEWSVGDMIAKKRTSKAVIVLPTGPKKVADAFTKAIRQAAAKQVITIVGAGDNAQATPWPKEAIIAAATDEKKKPAKFTDFGPNVTIFAPGVDVQAAWVGWQNVQVKKRSSTDCAAALVAGVVMTLQSEQKLLTVQATKEAMVKIATQKQVWNRNGSPGLFLYNGSGK